MGISDRRITFMGAQGPGVAQWIDRYGHRIRVIHADGSLVPTGPPLPSFEPPVPFRR